MALGAATLQKQHPHTQPYKSKKSPAPRFHAFAVAVLKALEAAYSAFAAAFEPHLRSTEAATEVPFFQKDASRRPCPSARNVGPELRCRMAAVEVGYDDGAFPAM